MEIFMKRKLIAAAAVAAVIGGFAVFFAFQAEPKNVLSLVRAENLEIENGVITVPERYTVIEEEAFAGKTEFNKVIIEGKAEIGKRAFYGCPNLRTVVMEQDCEIGEEAFADCSVLESVSANSGGGSCAENAFNGHGGLTIFCRSGSEILSVAQWADISYKVIE